MALTSKNYFSPRANRLYFSASQIKQFKKCEAQAMAEIRGKYTRPASQALMVGSYVDAALTGDIEAWKAEHPEILKRDGTLKAEFLQASEMAGRANRDELFMDYMEGEKQVILKAPILGGYWFKAKLDVLGPDKIVDLKTVKDLKSQYLPGQGRVDFATA